MNAYDTGTYHPPFDFAYTQIKPRWNEYTPNDFTDADEAVALLETWNTQAEEAHLPENLAFIGRALGQRVENKRGDNLMWFNTGKNHLFVFTKSTLEEGGIVQHGIFTSVIVTTTPSINLESDKMGVPLALVNGTRWVEWLFGYERRGPFTDALGPYNDGNLLPTKRRNNLYIPENEWELDIFHYHPEALQKANDAKERIREENLRALLQRLNYK